MSEGGVEALEEQARVFSESVDGLLAACFPDAPGMHVTELDDRVRIRPDGQGPQSGGVPLLARGQQLAWLRFHYSCRLDQTEKYLAIDYSNVWIVSSKDRTPLFRFEYAYDSLTKPHAHIQVHGERGTLSHLLSRTRHGKPHDMSALHLPTGGARFRPNLEDVVQFLLQDCQFDAVDGWLDAVHERRAQWRAIQTRAAARAMAAEAAAELRELGYTVTPPPGGDPEPGRKARFAW
ncbi:MAG: hypothetical protein ACTHOK_11550 [Nocardioidaceae bacterium]